MGNCSYCGKPVGLLKKSHKECEQSYQNGKSKILTLICEKGLTNENLNNLDVQIKQIANSNFIKQPEIKELLLTGWEKAVEKAFEDDVLSEDEEHSLGLLKEHFALSDEDIDRNGFRTKLVKGAVLRDIFNGIIPTRMNIGGNIPINLLKDEKIVWVFKGVNYYEQRTRTQYVGGSRGVGIRVAKGIHYRIGNFQGQRVQTSETVLADQGLLFVTNKHIHFHGNSSKRFRVPYNKIISFEPFADGIGIQRDAASAKPQTFVTGDGWFTYNLIVNLAQI